MILLQQFINGIPLNCQQKPNNSKRKNRGLNAPITNQGLFIFDERTKIHP